VANVNEDGRGTDTKGRGQRQDDDDDDDDDRGRRHGRRQQTTPAPQTATRPNHRSDTKSEKAAKPGNDHKMKTRLIGVVIVSKGGQSAQC
jgi:hypothetical protein